MELAELDRIAVAERAAWKPLSVGWNGIDHGLPRKPACVLNAPVSIT